MPRDANGAFALDLVYVAVPGQTIQAIQHNTPLQDLANGVTGSLARNGSGGMMGDLPLNNFRAINAAPATAPTDLATLAQAQANGVPVGTIFDYGGRQLPPGYLWPNGGTFVRTEYPDLDAAIYCGDALNATALFGYRCTSQATPETTRSPAGQFMVLPNLCEVVAVGAANMGGSSPRGLLSKFSSTVLGAMFGTQEHTLTTPQMPRHRPTFWGNPLPPHTHPTLSGRGGGEGAGPGITQSPGSSTVGFAVSADAASAGTPSGTISEIGGDQAHPNVQPTIVLNKIIKAKLI